MILNNQHIRGVIFDMGDVLFDATIWRKWLLNKIRQFGIHHTYDELFALWDARLVEAHLGKRNYDELLLEWFQSIGLTKAQISEINLENKTQRQKVEKTRMLFPGVMEMLKKLKYRGIKLAILSDTESPEIKIRAILETLKINKYFDTVVCSIDIGYVKPEKEAFQIVLSNMGLKANEAAFVGHDEDELMGADKMGMQVIKVRPGNQSTKEEILAEIDKIVQSVINT